MDSDLNDQIYTPTTYPEKSRGRPQRVSQRDFENTRNNLYGLFDQTWCAIARPLADLNSLQEISQYFESWRQAENGLYVLECLLRPESEEDGSRDAISLQAQSLGLRIVGIQSTIADLGQKRLHFADQIKAYGLRIEQLSNIGLAELPEDESKLLNDRRIKYAEELTECQTKYDDATQHERALSTTRKLLHARFAKAQLLEFCRNDDYEKNPRNLAKALAGLPFIGWRRSMARSSNWFVEVGGLGYRTFKVIEQIVRTWKPPSALIVHAKHWLEGSTSKHKKAVRILNDDWYFLMRAIETVQACPPRSHRDRARWIAQEYYRRSRIYTPYERELKEAFALEITRRRKKKDVKIEL